MKRSSWIFFTFALLGFISLSEAVEIGSHAVITQKTIPRTVLSNDFLLRELGLDEYNNNLGLKYYDYDNDSDTEGNSFTSIVERSNDKFEDEIIDFFKEKNNSITGWFMRGVIREDDVLRDGSGLRVLNHFFDPYNNQGLLFLGEQEKAPNWALGTQDAFTPILTPLPDYWDNQNHFTLFDAQEAMVRALSGQYIDSTGAVVTLDANQRKAYWATTFRALGDVVHLVQDMSQPQHTRGDAHSPFNEIEKQVYEEFTNKRALINFPDGKFKCIITDESGSRFEGPISNETTPLKFALYDTNTSTYVDYPIPVFDKYSDFFSTQPDGNTQDGKGLADYSNRSFFTAGTNKGTAKYPSPEFKVLTKTNETFNSKCVNTTPATFTLHNGYVVDQYDSKFSDVVALTARSVWDVGDPGLPQYALTQKNYIAMADNLIPRAVAYSAGMINHFFRGRLDVTKVENTADTAGNSIIAITIKNTSAQYLSMTNGKLEIFYDAIVDGVEIRKAVQLADGETGDVTEINNGAEIIINIISPTDVDPDKKNPFVVVFQGNIGIDPGVAGKVFNPKGETAALLFYVNSGNHDLLIKRSVDEGATWTQVNDPNLNGFKYFRGSNKGNQFLPSGKGRGILPGHIANGLVTSRTTDNGKTWPIHLDQNFGQYTEILNVVKAVHVGGGRLITFNNYYSSSRIVGNNTYISYDVELSESFDDGETWSPLNFPLTVNGQAVHLYYLGNQHMYMFTSGYEDSCSCVTSVWYESFDSGTNFSKASFIASDLEWSYGSWYRDAFAFDTEEIITLKDTSTNINAVDYSFAISSDGGKTLVTTDKVSKSRGSPQAEPTNTRPLGQGKFLSYVFDPWTAYENNDVDFYEGILVSNDKGQTWKEVYQNRLLTDAAYPYFLMLGVVTEDISALNYIH